LEYRGVKLIPNYVYDPSRPPLVNLTPPYHLPMQFRIGLKVEQVPLSVNRLLHGNPVRGVTFGW